MTGENTLTLNQATLVKAIQYWLEHEVMKAPVFRPDGPRRRKHERDSECQGGAVAALSLCRKLEDLGLVLAVDETIGEAQRL